MRYFIETVYNSCSCSPNRSINSSSCSPTDQSIPVAVVQPINPVAVVQPINPFL